MQVAQHSSTLQSKERQLAALTGEMRSREADLARLREQLLFQEEMEAKARKLKETYDKQREGGIYLTWGALASIALVGLVATLYLSSRIQSPQRKGYEQVFMPKDH